MFCIKSMAATTLVRALGLLPLAGGRALGSSLGRLVYRLDLRMTKISRENLAICLPGLADAERERLTLASLRETGKLGAEICHIWSRPAPALAKLIRGRRGTELVEEALAGGNGLLLLGPHLGNWEMIGLQLAEFGHVITMYQPVKLAGLDRFIRQSRSKTGCELVPTNTRGVAIMLRALQDNGIGAILPDQVPGDLRAGRFVPFFNEPALTMTLIHKLLQRSGCKALFGYAKRVDGGFELIFRAPPAELYSSDEEIALRALNRGIEALVLEAPAQYQWEYKRFKRSSPTQQKKRYQY